MKHVKRVTIPKAQFTTSGQSPFGTILLLVSSVLFFMKY